MRKLKFVSVFVLLALLLSAASGAVMADDPPPDNRANPNYVYTAEELEALAAKDRRAKRYVEELKKNPQEPKLIPLRI